MHNFPPATEGAVPDSRGAVQCRLLSPEFPLRHAPVAEGEAGEGRDSALPGEAIPGAVPGIDAVDGWVLVEDEEQDGDGFWRPVFDAVRGDERQRLGVSRWRFTPTQARFEWLVRSGFPMMFRAPSGCLAPFHDEAIDTAIAAAALGEAA